MCGQLHMSHPRLSLRTSLGDRAVLRDRSVHTWYGTDGSHLTLSQARSVNLLGICFRGGVNGATRWLTVKIHQAHGGQDRWFLPNSVRILSQDRCIPFWGCMGSLTTGSRTGPLSTFGESGLNVQSGHSKDSQGPSCAPLGLDSFFGLSSPVLFPGVREPSGASCVSLSFDLG